MPPDLLRKIRRAAKRTGLSLADAMRQSMKLGLPKLEAELSMKEQLTRLKPMTQEESRKCWEMSNPEFDELEHHIPSNPYAPEPVEE